MSRHGECLDHAREGAAGLRRHAGTKPRASRWRPGSRSKVSGAELLASDGRIRKELGGTEVFLAIERLAEAAMPRDVSGVLDVSPQNSPHGFRPVYFFARQIDDAKVWTSAMFITFR